MIGDNTVKYHWFGDWDIGHGKEEVNERIGRFRDSCRLGDRLN